MSDLPWNIITYAFADRFIEPFCYGCATYLVFYRFTRRPSMKIFAVILGVLVFLVMDDIWGRVVGQQTQLAFSFGDSSLSARTGEQVGVADYDSGTRSGLYSLFKISIRNLVSAILFVPFGFFIGHRMVGCTAKESAECNTAIENESLTTPLPDKIIPEEPAPALIDNPSDVLNAISSERITVKPDYQPEKEISIGDARDMLSKGQLSGKEQCSIAGAESLVSLNDIVGFPKTHNESDTSKNENDITEVDNMEDGHKLENEKELAKSNNESEYNSSSWIIGLIFFCSGIIAYGYFISGTKSSNIGFLIGYSLISVLIIYGIFHAIFIRKQAKASAGVISFFLIYLAFIIGGTIRHDPDVAEAKKMLNDFEDSFDKTMSAFAIKDGMPQISHEPIDTDPTTSGTLGEAERFMKMFMEEVRLVRNEYLMGIEDIKWMTILDENRLKNDPDLVESKAMIQSAKKLVEQSKQKSLKLFDKGEGIINSLDISESLKQDMLKNYRSGLAQGKATMYENWNLEADVMHQFELAFELLERRNGYWGFENGSIVFEYDTDVAEFNSIMKIVEEITVKQMQIQKGATDQFKGKMKEWKNSL